MKKTTSKFLALLLTLVMVLGMLPMTALAADPAHPKEGYTSIWSEGFESGIPDTWRIEDKDNDGFNWEWSDDVGSSANNPPCHGDWCVLSESYSNDLHEALSPNNWLYLPSFNLTNGNDYLLTFMMQAQDDDYLGDKVGVYISTNGGTSYTQLGSDYDTLVDWREIEVNLSSYAGQTVSIAVVHHNSRDKFVVKLDCFNLWKKGGTTPGDGTLITSVEVINVTEPVIGAAANFTWSIPDDADYAKDSDIEGDDCAWVKTSAMPESYADLVENGVWAYASGYGDVEINFEKDKYYTFVASVKANEGAEFPDPIIAQVNDCDAFALEQETGFAVVWYTFGPLEADDTPATPTITVTPETATVAKGELLDFDATVTGLNDTSVTWSVEGNDSDDTDINGNGTLTVGEDETATELTVKATANAETPTSLFATAIVTVTEPTGSGGDEQDSGTVSTSEGDPVQIIKRVTPTNDGTYKITMEAYVTGSIKQSTPEPLDIVLVLDQSGSMAYNFAGNSTSDNTSRRQYAMKQAVNNFIDAVGTDSSDHRIAVVTFGTDAAELKSWTKTDETGAAELKSAINGLVDTPTGATNVAAGMTTAQTLLNNPREDAQQIVIVFTDGVPTISTQFSTSVANNALEVAEGMKTAGAEIYTVGIFNGAKTSQLHGDKWAYAVYSDVSCSGEPGSCWGGSWVADLFGGVNDFDALDVPAVNRFLNYLSSNFEDADKIGITKGTYDPGNTFLGLGSGEGWRINSNATSVDSDYYLTANNLDTLNNVFTRIAESIIPNVEADDKTVLVDTLTDFFLFNEADTAVTGTSVKVATASGNEIAPNWTEEESALKLEFNNGTVSVTGFDYSANPVVNGSDGWTGKKLIISFDIALNPDANWRPGENLYDTNAGAGLNSAAGTPLAKLEDSPQVLVTAYKVSYAYEDTAPAGAPALPAEIAQLAGSSVKRADSPTLDGYTFNGWNDNSTTPVTLDDENTFVMPERDVLFTGSWTKVPVVSETQTIEIPFNKYVMGENAESKTFEFDVAAYSPDVSLENVFITGKSIETKGAQDAPYSGTITISGPSDDISALETSGIVITETSVSGDNWTYDDERFIVKFERRQIVPASINEEIILNATAEDVEDAVEPKLQMIVYQEYYDGDLYRSNYAEPTFTNYAPYTITIPMEKLVKDGGNVAAPSETFTFELDIPGGEDMSIEDPLTISGNTLTTEKGTYEYSWDLNIEVNEEMFYYLTDLGFYLREKNDGVDNWKYSPNAYHVQLDYSDVALAAASDVGDTSTEQSPTWLIEPVTAVKAEDGTYTYEHAETPEYVDKASFTNTYTKNQSSGGGDVTRYILTYESNGGTTYPNESYSYGTKVDLNKTPVREGYDFTGWYSDKGATNKITSVTMTSNKTVYAGWSFNGPLNTQDHVAYVKGYPDGTVGPNNNITRAETAVMLYRLLTKERSAEITTTVNSFSDVSTANWYNTEVSSMAKGGYVFGYEDGTFGGDKAITRAEFVTMMVRFINPAEGTKTFTDVPTTHWAYKNIATATAAGWIDGYTDGSFGPDKFITRAEAMTIINRVLNRGVDEDSTLLNFKKWPDNKASDWFYYDVIEATNGHEYTGSRPSEDWTKLY